MGEMKNQLRVRKPESTPESPESKQENTEEVGGREFGQVVEPMQAQMASGNDGLAEKSAGEEKKTPHKGKDAA